MSSVLSASPCFASETMSKQSEPVMTANIFQIIEDAIQAGERINDVLTNQDRSSEQAEPQQQTGQENPIPSVSQTQSIPSQQPNNSSSNTLQNSDTHQLFEFLNKRANETHEEWYTRIDPIILRTRRDDYRAWRETLSAEDNNAYDAITRQRNHEARDRANEMIPIIIEDVLTAPPQEERGLCRHDGEQTGTTYYEC